MALTSRKLFHGLPVLVLLLALIAEVAPSQSFDREVPRRVRRSSNIESKIFRGNWWDYYNRGIRKFDEGDLVGAEADFREAIKYKSEGGPRARTYGVRFQEYFPYAELGAVLFEQGKYTEAIPILQKSLRTTQLEQSRFYLHEARKQAALSSPIDQYSPTLELLEPIRGIITNRDSILVRGLANDDLYVDSIVVQGQDLIIDCAQDRIDFETEVPLPRNTNEITVTVTDLVGRTASQSVIVQVDREGPVFSLRELKVSPTGTAASLTGTAFDPNGVQSIRVGQSDLAIQKGTSQTIDLKVDLEPGQSAIQVELADGFGNTTRALLDLTQKSGSAKPFGAIRVAALGFDPRWLVGAGASAPRIEFLGVTSPQKVYIEDPYIDGRVYDPNGVEEISFNGERLPIPKGTDLYFGCVAGPLESGTHTIEVTARNSAGYSSTNSLTLLVKLLTELQSSQQLALALPDFEVIGEGGSEAVSANMKTNLVGVISERNRFTLVESDRLSEVFVEQRIGFSEASQTRYQPGVHRRLITADLVLDGELIVRRNSLQLAIYIVDVKTGSIEGIVDVMGAGRTETILRDMAIGISRKLEQRYPEIYGEVIAVKPRVLTNLSTGDDVHRNMEAIAFKKGEEVFYGDRSYGTDYYPLDGRLFFSRVLSNYSEVQPLPENPVTEPIEVGDRVRVR
ncbi:MAG: hypothetical protein KC994_07980 [Candidatus Omnitrophica bacterium]|nr:hypothetical protein [Candidatus Omnitrophota bacterium]